MPKNREIGSFTAPEVQIAFEVAMNLRMLPRFTDDGVPEGTVERPIAVEPVVKGAKGHDEEEPVEIVIDPPQ